MERNPKTFSRPTVLIRPEMTLRMPVTRREKKRARADENEFERKAYAFGIHATLKRTFECSGTEAKEKKNVEKPFSVSDVATRTSSCTNVDHSTHTAPVAHN